ncbi:ACP S-malonyltransferase [Chitinophaga pendula]|uniref:ACP S-malonyltransferase n=1 Tax=Chitinophaga TaxID=79328 RepID=UPI000BAEAB03|nr:MULTISPECIES: ACP S-malonyltransferase [Chitinophaga]ASZ12602.1 [acyl-carrier-protein] S-malonyltransferase [Chitinophaga sp. MD30]UCJ09794.1 ACP S-malonyltransferase [Chitinophaga pendula]
MKIVMFPGQGSQFKGMGKDLFAKYQEETRFASQILGYDMEELCVRDPRKELGKTAFTQPALYVVNAFAYYEWQKSNRADYLVGHSLGEYNALLAAGAFDFETGLKLVQKRGALMAAASGGGMAAVLGHKVEDVRTLLLQGGYTNIDIANFNTPTQIVVAGPQEAIDSLVKDFDARGIKIIPLFVSAPFHSRYMQPAADEFASFLHQFSFTPLQIPVIANVTAQPYEDNNVRQLLASQVANSVQWTDTIRMLMGKGAEVYEEIGGAILTKMVNEIKDKCTPIVEEKPVQQATPQKAAEHESPDTLSARLGSQEFKKEYGVSYTYVAGAMYRGIASRQLVIRMGKAGMLSFLGTGGMSLTEMEENITAIQRELTKGEPYGLNFLHNLNNPSFEMKVADLFLKYEVKNIEASAFMQMTPALVYYRAKGLKKGADGQIICQHRILAKISRPEVAEIFMRPAPEKIIRLLLEENLITAEQAALSKEVPMSYDICVEADSGGHTDRGIATVLLPAIQSLRQEVTTAFAYGKKIRIGLGGGIGTPQAATCAYVMGADFILTGSINQCTVEAGTSDTVKDLLQDINVQDTDYAPAGDMFEIGAKVQVLKKGVLFAARANKLYALYNQYNALEEIPEKTIVQLERNYFNKTIAEIWEEVKIYFRSVGAAAEITKAEQLPKNKMALVFRWYFGHTNRLAFEGNIENKVNFQIHTGSALGAFNQWVKGTELENWRNRHVDKIGINIMEGAAQLLERTALMVNS